MNPSLLISEPVPPPDVTLCRIQIQGFKSLKDVDLQDLNRISVFIGPNGAGKSNLWSALHWLPLLQSETNLTLWIQRQGGVDAVLHGGPKQTQSILMRLEFKAEPGTFAYEIRINRSRNRLAFEEERVEFQENDQGIWQTTILGSGHSQSMLNEPNFSADRTVKAIRYAILRMGSFHFHDTTEESALRREARLMSAMHLSAYGQNLPSFLRMLHDSPREDDRTAWRRITELTQRIAPYIKTIHPKISLISPAEDQEISIFEAQNRPDLANATVSLTWKDMQDRVFSAYDFSDGTLRALALFTALDQPWDRRPRFIAIDEPELGLHPAALHLFCALCRSVSRTSQLFLATQSLFLLNQFDPSNIIVAEQHNGETRFKQLSKEDLSIWLEDYSLAEIFEKNVIGGYP